MKTNIIKWEKSMVARCLARYKNSYAHPAMLPPKVKSYKAAAVKASPISTVSVDIPAGEWDGFEYALNSTLKKSHK